MTKKNALKKQARVRMKDSGERYTDALRGVRSSTALNAAITALSTATFDEAMRVPGYVIEVTTPVVDLKDAVIDLTSAQAQGRAGPVLRAALRHGTSPITRALAHHGAQFHRYLRDPQFLSRWTCPDCHASGGLAVGDGFPFCVHCDYTAMPEIAADDYIRRVLDIGREDVSDSNLVWPLHTCPECEKETLVDRGPTGGSKPEVEFLCFSCGREWTEADLRICDACFQPRALEGEQVICDECLKREFERQD